VARTGARIGVMLVSDWHAYYGNLENLLKQIAYERHRFLGENPDGTFVVVFNGDNAGLSAYSHFLQDEGELVYDFYRVLARDPRVRLVVGVGNHDAFDFEGARGNELFYMQTSSLVRDVRPYQGDDFRVTNANLERVPDMEEFISPYRDIETGQGKLRFVGFVLNEFFKKSSYSPTEGRKLFLGLTPMARLVDRVVAEAVRDGVRVLVPMGHDYASHVIEIRKLLERANQRLPPEKRIRIAWALAGHDHIQSIRREEGVLNAGSNGGAVFGVIEADGSLGEARAYRPAPPGRRVPADDGPWNTHEHLSTDEAEFLARHRPAIEAVRQRLETVVGVAPERFVRKELVKKGAAASGVWMADVMALWAWERMPEDFERLGIRGVVAFWNSSSYRYDFDIEAGESVTEEMQFGVYPLAGRPPRRGIARGSTLLALYASARHERMQKDSTHTPQLSHGFRERNVRGRIELEWLHPVWKRWLPVQPDDRFLFAIDGFLGSNGYDISGWNELLAEVEWFDEVEEPVQRSIMLRLAPKLLLPPPGGPACGLEIVKRAI
jgi:hypothetical protein